MDKAKRAQTAETPKQPSLGLKLRAPYLYPDRAYSARASLQMACRLRTVYHPLRKVARCEKRFSARPQLPDQPARGSWDGGFVPTADSTFAHR
jgi:hypothetical protein